MAQREIIVGTDHPVLRRKANKIRKIDESVKSLAADMFETMRSAPGVGLAAPQVGVPLRIIVVEIPADPEENEEDISVCLCNPEVVRSSGEVFADEGCLSLPGWVGEVPRAEKVTVKAVDLEGKECRIKAEGFFARVLQHEIDHLEGILYPDRVQDPSKLRRDLPREEAPKDEGDSDLQ